MAEELRAPRRNPKGRKPRTGTAKALAFAIGRAIRRQPAGAALTFAFGGLCVMTLVNALALQSGRNPPRFLPASAPRSSNPPPWWRRALPRPCRRRSRPAASRPLPGRRLRKIPISRKPSCARSRTNLPNVAFYTGAIDGKSGQQTSAAIRKVEEALGMPVTGCAKPAPPAQDRRRPACEERPAPKAKPEAEADPLRGLLGSAGEEQASVDAAEDRDRSRPAHPAGSQCARLRPAEGGWRYRPSTKAAIEAFQQARKLKPTARLGAARSRCLPRKAEIALH